MLESTNQCHSTGKGMIMNKSISISVTKRCVNVFVCVSVYVCVCVCETAGWLDIHVALIIVPLLLGSHSGIRQTLMWV